MVATLVELPPCKHRLSHACFTRRHSIQCASHIERYAPIQTPYSVLLRYLVAFVPVLAFAKAGTENKSYVEHATSQCPHI